VLDVIEQENLLTSINTVGGHLQNELAIFVDRYDAIGDVRGHGLFIGIDWVKDSESRKPDRKGAEKSVERMKEKGFLISNAGQFRNVLKIRPPLIFEKQHADQLLNVLAETVEEMHV
jgi:4-aminobutyrate aminotransferase-like enzyme